MSNNTDTAPPRDSDPAATSRNPPLEERIDSRRTALLVVDMQNDFVHPSGATERWMRKRMRQAGNDLPPGPSLTVRMVPRLERLIAVARDISVPVVWVRIEHNATSRDRFTKAEGWLYCDEGTWGAEWYGELGPRPGERVVVKRRHSAFFGTELDAMLRQEGVEGVIVTGTATQGCVEATLRDANAYDYWAVVVGDCCGQLDESAHKLALERMDRVFGMCAQADEIIHAWQGRTAGTGSATRSTLSAGG